MVGGRVVKHGQALIGNDEVVMMILRIRDVYLHFVWWWWLGDEATCTRCSQPDKARAIPDETKHIAVIFFVTS